MVNGGARIRRANEDDFGDSDKAVVCVEFQSWNVAVWICRDGVNLNLGARHELLAVDWPGDFNARPVCRRVIENVDEAAVGLD